MGIGGIGMSGLAQVLLERGDAVSGCDLAPSELAYRLEARGAVVYRGHDPHHVNGERGKVDTLVISTAVPADHPEVAAAQTAGVRVIRRIELLGELMENADSIGVVGTHGKTTTTSMVATILERAGLHPTAVVGGEVGDIGGNAKLGDGRVLVAEVDESDTLFQNLKPKTAVITNVDNDHVASPGEVRRNYHASFEALQAAFSRYASRAQTVVYCADWPGLREIVDRGARLVAYGTAPGLDFQAAEIASDGSRASYTLVVRGEPAGRVDLQVPGLHNVLNSLGALAASVEAGVGLPEAIVALRAFRGAHRRWERVGTINGAWIIDDYAHHPTEADAVLKTARATGRRVRVVFQPHRYLRTAQLWPQTAEVLRQADEVLLLDLYSAGEAPIEGVHSGLIVDRLRELGHGHAAHYPSREEAVRYLQGTAGPDDLIITMGAGDVWKVGTELAAATEGVKKEQ
ncbi:MAG TPA: UDP-N-acetylmuramate--L-alanine ligase [Deinococcales bacterium]|nr:UDP-N-acetylmuramate--L-alanine ligase [Deinococcales bacterium]